MEKGKDYDVQTWASGIKQGIVYGSIKVSYLGDNRVRIYKDLYDFDIHPWSSISETFRNMETIGADVLHGSGTPFYIKFRGINIIKHTYNTIKSLFL